MTNFRFRRPCISVSAAFALCLGSSSSSIALAQDQEQTPAPARITQKVNESSLVRLRGNTAPLAQPRYDAGVAPGSKVASRLILVLTRSAAQEASLQTWLDSVQDVNSANYHQWLTPEDFGKRFGVSDADLATVESWLSSHGFSVNKVSPGRMSIEFSGTTAQVEAAFHTSVHSYVINGVQHWANAADPQIPTALASVVAGVAKLNDFNPRSTAVRGPSGAYNPETKRIEPTYTLGSPTNGYTLFVGPADAATIYDTPTTYNASHSGTLYDGTGVTIGIAGDSNIDITQNANYRATFGLPVNATTVVVDGADPGENGDAIEAYLDTQVAGGIAPNANVILYAAANTYLNAGLFLAISRAVDDNQVDILNISFSGCEADQGASGNQYIYNLWQQAAAQGISLTVSTGDSGSAGCDNENTETVASLGLAVNALASTPYNIAVGGTDFDALYSNFPSSFTQYVDITNTLANHRGALKYIPERPWNDSTFQGDNTTISANVPWSATQFAYNAGIVAAGGGVSACVQQSAGTCIAGYPVPSWQSGFAAAGTGRNLPDVSFLAGNGLYGAVWGLCTDQEYDGSGNIVVNCAGNPTTGSNFNLTGVGGTSAAAPAFAGMLALLKQKTGSRLGQADYVLYDLANTHYNTVFHDIQSGNNSVACTIGTPSCAANTGSYDFMTGYNAGVGFDEASGLGSVDASQMVSNWASAALIATNSSLTLNGVTASLNITHGTSVAVKVGVTGGGGTPAGSVALVDSINPATVPNSGSIDSFILSSGTATGTTDSLPGGTYNVSAHYGGSQTFTSSDSNAIPVTVSAESSTTSLTIKGYFDPKTGQSSSTPYYGFFYLLDAQPYGNSASLSNPDGGATGTITFKSGTTTIGTAALASDGIAELQTTTLPGGSDVLSASFPGDNSFLASTSSPSTLLILPAVTTLSTPNYQYSGSVAGSPVPLSVQLSVDSVGAAPGGTVNFQDGTTSIGSVSMMGTAGSSTAFASGSASFTTTTLTKGTHSINAVYGGDGNYARSTSSSISVLISPMGESLVVIPPAGLTPINQAVPVTVNMSAFVSNGLPGPTGTITLSYNGATSPPVNVVNSSAAITIPANTLPVGTTTVTANYSGDQYYDTATSMGFVNMKGSGSLTPAITVTGPPGVASYPVAVNVTVRGGSGAPVATGNVLLNGALIAVPPIPLVNGTATYTFQSGLVGGQNSLTATYLGDSNYTNGVGTGTFTVMVTPNVYFPFYAPGIIVNQPLSVTVNVAPGTGVPGPTGTVTLSSGSYTSSATPLVSGSATINIPANSFAVGNDTLTATYSGDTNYSPGTGSEPVTVSSVPIPTIGLTGTNLTVVPGATTNNLSTITVSPMGGFTGSVSLTAALTNSPAGAVDLPTFSFGTTSPMTITAAASQTATLTVSTTAAATASLAAPWRPGTQWRHGAVAFACLMLFGIGAVRRRGKRTLLMLMLLVVLVGGAISCGGGGGSGTGGSGSGGGNSNPGTTPGAYTVTVTATSGTISATTTINLNVN
jgi:hypothetical protein